MPTKFGPTFVDEIKAAGLFGLPFSWGVDDGSIYADGLTEEQRATLDAVVAAHDPTKQLPPPVPVTVSDRQFFQALAMMGQITKQEALDAVRTGVIPAQLQTFIDGMADPTKKFDAEMRLTGAVEFHRADALVAAFAAANGWTNAQVDDLWRLAGSL